VPNSKQLKDIRARLDLIQRAMVLAQEQQDRLDEWKAEIDASTDDDEDPRYAQLMKELYQVRCLVKGLQVQAVWLKEELSLPNGQHRF
jgi:hypothetical protein